MQQQDTAFDKYGEQGKYIPPEATNITVVFLSHISNCLHILSTSKQYLKTAVYIDKYNSVTKPMDVYDICHK